MHSTIRVVAALVAATGLARAGDSPNVVTGISFEDQGAAVVMTVTGARPPVFTSFEMQEPPRFVLDLEAEGAATLPQDLERSDGAIRRVQTFRYGVTPSSIVRVLVTLVPGAAPSWDVVNVSSEWKALRVRIAKAKGSPPVRAQSAPSAPPSPRDRVEEDGAVVVVNGGRWGLAIGPELPLRGPGPCRIPAQAAPGGSCARPVMLVDLGAIQRGSRVFAGTVPGCGEWRAVSVTTERDFHARITLEPRAAAAERNRAVVEVDLAPRSWNVLDAIPAVATCVDASRCTWVHVVGFSPTGAFAYAVGPGKANAPGAPSELKATHLVTDRTLVDVRYAREASGVLVERHKIAQGEPWLAAGPTAPFDVVFEGGEVKLRRADGASKRVGKLPKGSAPPRVLGCFQSPAERRMAVVVATGAPGGIAVFGAHQDAGFPGYSPASVPLADAPPEAVGALVRAGADPNRTPEGGTPLVTAVDLATDFQIGSDLDVALVRVRALLAAGADANRPDAKGRTALGEAVAAAARTLYWNDERDEEEIDESRASNNQIPRGESRRQRRAVIEALLARGADPSAPTETGISPAAHAYCDGDAELRELFSKAKRGTPVTARALLAQSPSVKDWSARQVLDGCALAHLAEEGGTPEEIYAAATRPTQVGTVPLARVLDLAADHPAIAAKARTDPALAEGRNDARVRVALGLDRLDDPATLRRVLAAAGSLEPAGVELCGVSALMIPSWSFTNDGHVEVTEPCPNDAGGAAGEEPDAGSDGRCTTRGMYTVSGKEIVVTFPGRPPQRSEVHVSGLTVSVAGVTNAERECPADP